MCLLASFWTHEIDSTPPATTTSFSPVRASAEDLKRFHGTNERISTANYVEMIQFYHQLIGNASADISQDRSLP